VRQLWKGRTRGGGSGSDQPKFFGSDGVFTFPHDYGCSKKKRIKKKKKKQRKKKMTKLLNCPSFY
jgi:hypothetical protein